MTKRRIVVTGGRSYSNRGKVWAALDALDMGQPIGELAHGGASGADRLAAEWATANDIDVTKYNAHWSEHGRGAGPIRNQFMLEHFKPDLVVAFPGGRGTADCVARAEKMGIIVLTVGE